MNEQQARKLAQSAAVVSRMLARAGIRMKNPMYGWDWWEVVGAVTTYSGDEERETWTHLLECIGVLPEGWWRPSYETCEHCGSEVAKDPEHPAPPADPFEAFAFIRKHVLEHRPAKCAIDAVDTPEPGDFAAACLGVAEMLAERSIDDEGDPWTFDRVANAVHNGDPWDHLCSCIGLENDDDSEDEAPSYWLAKVREHLNAAEAASPA